MLSFLTGSAPQYTVFKLSDPHRIIVDLPEFSLSDQADLSIAENDFITSVEAEKIQDNDRNYLRLTVALKDNFAYSTTSDAAALNIDISRKTSQPASVPADSAKQQVTAAPARTGGSVISAIVPHTGKDGMTVEIGSQIPIGKFNAYTLQNPYRLVVDIPGAKSVLADRVFL